MDYRDISKQIFTRGKEKIDDMEVYIERTKSINIRVFNGVIDEYSIAESGGLSLRGISNGKMGYSYTEKIDETSIDMLINEVCENSKYIDSQDEEAILTGSDKYKDIDDFNKSLEDYPIKKKIDFVKELEKEALSLDSRIVSVQNCAYSEFDSSRYIINTKDIDLRDRSNAALTYISVVAKEGQDTKTGMGFKIFRNFKDIDYKKIAKEAVDQAISQLGAKSISSGDYPVIIENYIFAGFLQAFSSVFSADSVQKNLSLLKGKIGESIASEKLNIVDDPHLKDGFASSSFDDEGTKTEYKKIVDKGILNTYLYNWKTAKIDGKESTGNAKRSSYKSSIDIGSSNFYIEKGEKDLKEMIDGINKGVYLTKLEGLHSGLNPVSGDFSLSASGFKIENGDISEPIDQIIVSGNFFHVLNDIEDVGNDLKIGSPMSISFGSPSVKIKKLSIAGN